MRNFTILVFVILALTCTPATAAQPINHFNGVGVFIWQGVAKAGTSEPFAAKAKARQLSYVVIKAFDGKQWGTKVHGHWTTQWTGNTAKRFHSRGVKVYAYGTAYLYEFSNKHTKAAAKMQLNNAIKVLHMGADGIIWDDVFNYGKSKQTTEYVIGGLARHMASCKYCRGKAHGFSTFPHALSNKSPWYIPFKYCRYFFPQEYWVTFGIRPLDVLVYGQSSFDGYIAYHKIPNPPRLIPTGQAYAGTVRPKDIESFFSYTYPCYKGACAYRWELMSEKNWQIITHWAKMFRKPHDISSPGCYQTFKRSHAKTIPKQMKVKPKPAHHTPKPAKHP